MKRRSLFWVALFTLFVCALPGTAPAITVETGFLATNPQIFPVGDLVSIEAIQDGEDIDLGTLPALFRVRIANSTPEELSQYIALQVKLETSGMILVDYISRNFQLREWIDGPGRNGTYNNIELNDLDLGERSESSYGDRDTFLNLLDGSNLSAGLYVLTVTVFDVVPNDENGELGAPIANGSSIEQIQVYNPSPPELQSPSEGEEISALPLFFTWNWNAGFVSTEDIKLIIVEGLPGEDGETVIESRNSANTRYDGPPQSMESHTYTGISGSEQSFTPGETYYWMVRFNVNTVIPGSPRTLDSNVFSFVYAPPEGAEPPADSDQGGNDPLLDQLSAVLPSEVMQGLYENFTGYSYQSMIIDGVSGYNQMDLFRLLNSPTTTIVTVGIED